MHAGAYQYLLKAQTSSSETYRTVMAYSVVLYAKDGRQERSSALPWVSPVP